MKKILLLLTFIFAFCQIGISQTIKKEASNNNPYIGEEFYYTITIENIVNLSDLDRVEDILGPDLEYLGYELNSSMVFLHNSALCNSITGVYDSTPTVEKFILYFNNCSGQALGGLNTISFKIKVSLKAPESCQKTKHTNKATLILNEGKSVHSDVSKVTINKSNPFTLQKTFRDYDTATKTLTYDIRLSSESGNFKLINFNAIPVPYFKDVFTIPSCFTLDATNPVEVVYVSDERPTSFTTSAVSFNSNVTATNINLDWDLLNTSSASSSILYQVKIKVDDCSCVNQLFQLQNQVSFEAEDLCGNPIRESAQFDIKNVSCNNNDVEIPLPIEKEICFSKELQLDNNDLNLTMKGCTGKYNIKIENCSGRIIYKNFTLTDVIPSELDINTPIVINGNATYTLINNNLTVTQTAYLQPGEIIEISIPFIVNTPKEDLIINNCAILNLYGYDNFNNVYNVNEQECAVPLTTVPNQVAINLTKTICNQPDNPCGPYENKNNIPGDTVEYTLHFYNYGTVEAINVSVEDYLPAHFKIEDLNRDVKIYKKNSGRAESGCDTSTFSDITHKVRKKYSKTTNQLVVGLRREKLKEFTCDGVVHYVIKVNAKIDINAPNGIYENVFKVNYENANDNSIHNTLSNKVTSVVNVDNLVIADKRQEDIVVDCENNKTTVTYKIILANMGGYSVFVDIDDVINVPSPISIISFGDFKKHVNGTQIQPFSPTSLTANSFNINGLELQPCEFTEITYTAVYNNNLLTKDQEIEVCNGAKIKTYIPYTTQIVPIATGNTPLIQRFIQATTTSKKLEAITLIKAYKSNKKPAKNTVNIDIGKAQLNPVCVTLKDCLPDTTNGCFSDNSTSFGFSITGVNRRGEITTTLNNLSGKITKIEYLLSDIRGIETCENGIFYNKNGNPITLNCLGCSTNVTGLFRTTNTSSIAGTLNYVTPSTVSGTYVEQNKVAFNGLPTIITQDNRTFRLPVNVNCNGTFEFAITAIVYFEDCSVCYVTDAFDYNASYRYTIPNIGIGNMKPF